MWPEFERERPFVPWNFSRGEVIAACMMWGFTLGFGYFVVYHAYQLTMRVKRPTAFILLIWGEIFANLILYGLLYILVVVGILPPDNFWVWLFIIIGWIIQLQCLIQLIVNRICILVNNRSQRRLLKWSMFAWIGFINITVAICWIPATLQISDKWVRATYIYDRVEKVLYLITDAGLNYMFIWIVNRQLVSNGLTKYSKLVRFNKLIIWVSLAMDVLIIGLMFMKNPLVYLMSHPLAFIIKLEIEMSMSNLIILVARGTGVHVHDEGISDESDPTSAGFGATQSVRVQVHREAITQIDGELDEHSSLNGDLKSAVTANGDVHLIPMKNMKSV
ncbi:hypothetical protein BDV98DRAFT_608089 [Pterulicium gracile]|uniref:Transmembrane protein n=1 Tax=Pterulicium gracile TaxID=1884261 RepID=A0A5C3Q935_9AGAR|nr:hypothetical protein BDV98DRAFT_608089 [Pterula gracilis]